jgi:hypothetical protein
MLIVELVDGLGNQLFQYAAGRGIAAKLGVELKLDLTNYSPDARARQNRTVREYGLDMFGVITPAAIPEEIVRIKSLPQNKIIKQFYKIWRRITPLKYQHYITENLQLKEYRFIPEIFVIPNDCYLEGYWMSEKYFKHIEKDLRTELVFQKQINNELTKKIQIVNSVSVHFRRTDFLARAMTCDLSYYHQALQMLRQKIKNPVLFIFSDDIDWVKQNFQTDCECVYVEGNTGADDLQLMSRCKHHILANSTFSWWGAWLNSSPSKIVVVPDEIRISNNRDIIPNTWIVL